MALTSGSLGAFLLAGGLNVWKGEIVRQLPANLSELDRFGP